MLYRFLLSIVLILTISGCQSTQNTRSQELDLDGLDAQALLNEAAGQRNPRAQARLQIRAASVLAFNAEYQQAISVLESLATTDLADADLDQAARLLAQAHTSLGQLSEAEASLTNLSDWRAEDMLLLAQICEALRLVRLASASLSCPRPAYPCASSRAI